MGWGKVVEYAMAFVKWMWQNKWTMLFIATTIVFMSMYGCKRIQYTSLEKKHKQLEVDYTVCSGNISTITNTNKELEAGVDACYKELEILKKSYEKNEEIIKQFDEEIKKFKKLAEDIDSETDPEKQFEKKKKILEELFKGKNAVQIRSILRKM
jgi:chromosome segregation ATPase